MYEVLQWLPTIIVILLTVGAFFALRQMTIDLKETMVSTHRAIREMASQTREDIKHLHQRIESEQVARANEDKDIREKHVTLHQCEQLINDRRRHPSHYIHENEEI